MVWLWWWAQKDLPLLHVFGGAKLVAFSGWFWVVVLFWFNLNVSGLEFWGLSDFLV